MAISVTNIHKKMFPGDTIALLAMLWSQAPATVPQDECSFPVTLPEALVLAQGGCTCVCVLCAHVFSPPEL